MKVALLICAALGFAGAGAALAVSRLRQLHEGDPDIGLRGLTFVLVVFSAACTISAAGFLGVLAFGGVICWCSYILCAQRIGVFQIEYADQQPSEHAPR